MKNAPAAPIRGTASFAVARQQGSPDWKAPRSHLRRGRSRVRDGAISARARAAGCTPGSAARARRDERRLYPLALGPPRSHARARTGRHSRSTFGAKASSAAARGLRINRPSAKAGLDGRGYRSLVSVLGFHLDLADSRRSGARMRTVRRSKALRPRGARSRSRVLRAKRIWSSATGNRRKAYPRHGLPERQKRLGRARIRKKTPGT